MTPAIECLSLSKHYPRVDAVRSLNLAIPEGAIYALMGPNGAGKTTLIKMLMNLIRPTRGQAKILGQSSSSLRGQRLESIGYVSENQKMPDWMTVREYISYWRPFYKTWDTALEKSLLDRFELPAKQKLKNLSRGMRMKAQLACSLAYRPKLVILDEPLSGLDPLVRDELMATLVDSISNTTVLLSSHDLAEIDSFATHVGFLYAGQMQISQPIAQVHQNFRRVHVSLPNAPANPVSNPPQQWINYKFADNQATWTEVEQDDTTSLARIHQHFGAAQIESTPLTLREVFLVLAQLGKSSQQFNAHLDPQLNTAANSTNSDSEAQSKGAAL